MNNEVAKAKANILARVALFTLLLAVALFLYIFYLLLWPQLPLTVNSVQVTTPVVKSNGTLIYRLDVCKNTELTPDVHRKLVSATSAVPLTTTPGVSSPGCHITLVPIRMVPGTPPGTYILYTEVIYHVNPLRDVHVFWHTGQFQVVQ